MSRPWRLLTHRGRFFVLIGLIIVMLAMAASQRDVMRLGLLLVALPVIAAIFDPSNLPRCRLAHL
jgi:hypothetical protein